MNHFSRGKNLFSYVRKTKSRLASRAAQVLLPLHALRIIIDHWKLLDQNHIRYVYTTKDGSRRIEKIQSLDDDVCYRSDMGRSSGKV